MVHKIWMASICAVLLLSGMALSADWPNWRGPNHDGISLEKDWDAFALNDKTPITWTAEIGIGFSSFAVANGKLLTMGNVDKKTDVVWCFDAMTGKLLWKYEYPEDLNPKYYEGGPGATPTIESDRVYTISKTGKVFCLNLADGSVVWQNDLKKKHPEWGFSGSPLILGEKLILNAAKSGIALDKSTGQALWTSDDQIAGYATAVKSVSQDKTTIYIFGSEMLMGVDASSGKLLCSYPWKTSYGVNAADPIVIGQEVFITSGYNTGCALLKIENNELTKIWENKAMRSQMSGPVAIDGYLYGIDDNQLCCVEWKTGEKKWSEPKTGKGSLIAADGKLIVLGEKGRLMTAPASPAGFTEIAGADVLSGRCWTPPVLANGMIYARNAAGKLVCVDVRAKKTVSLAVMDSKSSQADWPQWKGIHQDNKNPETGLLKQWPAEGPAMLWDVKGLGDGYSTVSIADGRIYTTGMKDGQGFLTCVGLDGKTQWQVSYGPEWTKATPGVRCTPAVSDGKVYVISGVGQVGCFDAAKGDKIWQKDPFTAYEGKLGTWGVSQSPVIDGDKLFFTVGGDKTTMLAINKNTGDVIWESKSVGGNCDYCTPLLLEHGGRKLLATSVNKQIVGFDAADGAILWTFAAQEFAAKPRDINPVTPAYHDGMLFFTSGYDQGSVMLSLNADGSAVSKVWTNPSFDTHHGSVVVDGGYIYGTNWNGNGDGNWICADWKTGKTMYETSWENKGSLTYADGMLYCYEEKNGNVALVKADPKEFKVISSFQIKLGDGRHWAHPVVCGKRLYIRHGDALMAYDIAAQ